MQQVYPDQGLNTWLTLMTAQNLIFGLYVNGLSIDRSVTWPGSFIEASWSGYARTTLGSGAWTVNTVSHLGFAIGTPIAFSNTGGVSVTAYGYFVLDSTGTFMMAVAQFDAAPITIVAADSYVLIPSLGDLSKALTSP